MASAGGLFDLDELVFDLGQAGGFFEDYQEFVFADGQDLVRIVAFGHDVHQVLAVHPHSHASPQLLDVLLEDAQRDGVGGLEDHSVFVLQENVLELDQTDDVYRVILHINRFGEAIHSHSLGALPSEEP